MTDPRPVRVDIWATDTRLTLDVDEPRLTLATLERVLVQSDPFAHVALQLSEVEAI